MCKLEGAIGRSREDGKGVRNNGKVTVEAVEGTGRHKLEDPMNPPPLYLLEV